MLKGLKVLARSRSAAFARDYARQDAGPAGDALGSVDWWCGDARPVHYRRGTSDAGVIYDILFKPGHKGEYWLPEGLEPEAILDIGANIGIASRYLAHRFPGVPIHAFEPVPENQHMAERNFAGLRSPAPRLHPYGLGSADATVELAPAAAGNLGSFTFGSPEREPGRNGGGVKVELRAAADALTAIGVTRADVIKIDVEGAENDILRALPDALLAQASWIYGELHGESVDPRLAFAALERLAPWHDIEIRKPLRKRNWFFDACNRRISGRFRGFRRGR